MPGFQRGPKKHLQLAEGCSKSSWQEGKPFFPQRAQDVVVELGGGSFSPLKSWRPYFPMVLTSGQASFAWDNVPEPAKRAFLSNTRLTEAMLSWVERALDQVCALERASPCIIGHHMSIVQAPITIQGCINGWHSVEHIINGRAQPLEPWVKDPLKAPLGNFKELQVGNLETRTAGISAVYVTNGWSFNGESKSCQFMPIRPIRVPVNVPPWRYWRTRL